MRSKSKISQSTVNSTLLRLSVNNMSAFQSVAANDARTVSVNTARGRDHSQKESVKTGTMISQRISPNRQTKTDGDGPRIGTQVLLVELSRTDKSKLRVTCSRFKMSGYNYDLTSIRLAFDCLSKVIKFTVT